MRQSDATANAKTVGFAGGRRRCSVVPRCICRLVVALASIVLAGFVAAAAQADDPRPNVIMIVVDDLRWDELSCTGHPVVRTGNIDLIAQEGVRFRNAFATTPLCSPSRASLLTGLYAHEHGIVDNTNRSEQSHRLNTFPKRLHEAGYRTGFVGKWHMGNDDTARPGFDHWVGLAGQGTSSDPELNIQGQRQKVSGYTTDVLNEHAVEFVRDSSGAPFCLILAHKALHPELQQFDDGRISDPSAARFIPAPRHEPLYRDAAIPRRLNTADTLAGKPALQREIAGLPRLGPQTGTPDEDIRDRWRMLAAVDEGVGQLRRALEESDRLDDTVLIFTSDHGYWYGEHGLSVERRLAYEEGIRIPLLVRYPRRFPAGTLVDEMVLTLDLAPSVLELGNVPGPADLSGRSLIPWMELRPPSTWRTSFLVEHHSDNVFPRVAQMGYRALRTRRFKLIDYIELDGMDEMYDLRADPYELNNLIQLSEHQNVLAELQSELEKLVNDTRESP